MLIAFELNFALWIFTVSLLLLFHVSCSPLMWDLCFCFSELKLLFGSATAAAAAAESLYSMRDGIEVHYGQPLPLNTAREFTLCLYITKIRQYQGILFWLEFQRIIR